MANEYYQTYRNDATGLEAIITEGNHAHPYRVILRDIDADATFLTIFGSLEVCHDKAMEWVK